MEPLTVSGNLDSLSAIAKYTITAAKEAQLDKKSSYNLRLAVDEIATNIIMHGYEEANLEGDLQIKANITPEKLILIIEDCGQAYNPYQTELMEEKTIDLPIEERPIGGLGVFLAIKSVDEFTYKRIGDKNHNIFVMNRNH